MLLFALMMLPVTTGVRAEVTGSWEVYPSFNEIQDIAVHGDYVWCCTRGGVVRWNRIDGTHICYKDIPNYVYNTSLLVAIDSSDRAWLGTRETIVRIDGDAITTFSEADGYLAYYVSNIAVDQNDNIWIIPTDPQNRTLIMFDGSKWHSIDKPGDHIATSLLYPDSNGRIWVNTAEYPAYYHDGEWTVLDGEPNVGSIHTMAEDADGTLYFSTKDGIYTYSDSTFVTVYNGYTNANRMEIDSRGNIWIMTSEGLVKYDGRSFTTYPELDTEIDPADIGVDEDDNVWIGSWDNGQGGLVRFDGNDYTRFVPDCPTSYLVWQSVVDTSGTLWCATIDGLCSFDGETWQRHYIPGDPEPTAIVQDRTGDLWLGAGRGRGLYRLEGEQWTKIPGTDVLSFNYFNRSLVFDSDNTAWTFKRNTGLWRVNDTICEQVLPADSLSWAFMGALAIDHDDVKWIGTNDGVYRYDGETITHFQPSEDADFNRVTSIKIDSENRVWCGGASVFVIEDGVIELRDPPHERDDNTPFCSGVDLEIGPDGRVWAIMCDICAAGGLISGGFAVYEDGGWSIVPVPESIRTTNDIFAAPDGTIWISNVPGVIRFTPDSGPLAIEHGPQPESISLSCAPNPFNPTTTITFTLPRNGITTARVYNVTGQAVTTLVNGSLDAGHHALTWDASGCAAGPYFCRIISGNHHGVVKMTLVK